MKTSRFSINTFDYKLMDPVTIEWEKKKREEEERRKNPNGPFEPLYAPNPHEDLPLEKPKEEKPKRVIIIQYG